jgi:hypothetical protein
VDDLSSLLRTVSDNPPPTTIDLDRMIAGEGRRRRRARFTVAGAAGAVVAIAVAAFALVDRPPSDAPLPAAVSTVPPPVCTHNDTPAGVPKRQADPVRPLTEPHNTAAQRLDHALPELLPPGAKPMTGTGCDHIEFWWSTHDSRYNLGARLPGNVSLAIMIEARDRGEVPQCATVPDDCHRTDATDGSVTMSDLSALSDLTAGDTQRTVTVFRPDNTRVLLAAIGREQDLPSVTTLSAIGRRPELTLYP